MLEMTLYNGAKTLSAWDPESKDFIDDWKPMTRTISLAWVFVQQNKIYLKRPHSGKLETASFEDDCVFYDGIYYGDFAVSQEDAKILRFQARKLSGNQTKPVDDLAGFWWTYGQWQVARTSSNGRCFVSQKTGWPEEVLLVEYGVEWPDGVAELLPDPDAASSDRRPVDVTMRPAGRVIPIGF